MRGKLVVTTFTYKKNAWTYGVDASIMPYNVLNKIILNGEEKNMKDAVEEHLIKSLKLKECKILSMFFYTK